uniref:Talin-2 n=1 Tax=Sphaerodactylus townsendi TaxID=933632 RepID=A0ACB8E5P0_9SAUR
MLESSSSLIKTARSLAINPKDPLTWSVLASHSHTVSESIKSLITSIRDKAPGQRECDYSIDGINRCIRDIEQASLASVSQNLATRDDISVEVKRETVLHARGERLGQIGPAGAADVRRAGNRASHRPHRHLTPGRNTLCFRASKVTQLASYFEPLVLAAVGVVSKLMNHQQQMTLLDQTKTLAESALQMLYAAKEGGGNPKAQTSDLQDSERHPLSLCLHHIPGNHTVCFLLDAFQASHTHDAITEASQLMKEAVDDIMVTLNEAASEVGMVGNMVDSIAEAMSKLDEGTPPEPKGSFVDYQTTVVKYSKAIAVTAQEMSPAGLGGLASQVTQYRLTGTWRSRSEWLARHPQAAEGDRLPDRTGCKNRPTAASSWSRRPGSSAESMPPTDAYTKRELIECARAISEKCPWSSWPSRPGTKARRPASPPAWRLRLRDHQHGLGHPPSC